MFYTTCVSAFYRLKSFLHREQAVRQTALWHSVLFAGKRTHDCKVAVRKSHILHANQKSALF